MPGEEQSELIEVRVQVERVIHHRRRWRRTCSCSQTKAIVTAPPRPKVIPRGRFGEGFLARLLLWKFAWGLPQERVAGLLRQEGLALAPGTLCGLLAKLEPLLAPLVKEIVARNVASCHLHADETSWRVLLSETGTRWWLWVFRGPDTVAFVIKPSRGMVVVAEHLGIDLEQQGPALPDGRRLVLTSDFYAVYASLGKRVDGIENHYCWAHVRRHVRDVGRAHPSCAAWAAGWLQRIQQLFHNHRTWLLAPVDSEQERIAEDRALAGLEEMEQALQSEGADPALPRPAYKVLQSITEQWGGLLLPFTDATLGFKLRLDNNLSERHLRPEVVGRNNYYGSGSEWSARLAACFWTIHATIGLAGWNSLRFFQDYLRACALAGGQAPQDLSRFLPWQASPEDAGRWRLDPGGGP